MGIFPVGAEFVRLAILADFNQRRSFIRIPTATKVGQTMATSKTGTRSIELTGAQKRALQLLRRALDEVASAANIQDISVYRETEHYRWRFWAETSGAIPDTAKEPSEAWAIFREDLPHDVILRMQGNFYGGSAWIELSLLPISVLFLNLWANRLGVADAREPFEINDEVDYVEKVQALVLGNLRSFLLLLPVMLYDMWDDPLVMSVEAYIEQEIRPRFKKRWRSLGFPKDKALFPALRKELEENAANRLEFRDAWILKTHGGSRDKYSFDKRDDFAAIIDFISQSHNLWKYVIRFFADQAYEDACTTWVVGEAKFTRLSEGMPVPQGLLKKVLRKSTESIEELEPLSFAIEHARTKFGFKEKRATVRRHYYARLRTSSSETRRPYNIKPT